MLLDIIPAGLQEKCTAYFGSDKWFFTKHPELQYESPFSWVNAGKDIDIIESLLDRDINLVDKVSIILNKRLNKQVNNG